MDLAKFLLMLTRRSLRSSRAAEFKDDPFEGFCFVEHCDSETATPGEEIRAMLGTGVARAFEMAPKTLFVNSWSLGPESNLMWKAYSDSESSVAVLSSTHRYVDAVDWGDLRQCQLDCGPVSYFSRLEEAQRLRRDFNDGPYPMGDELIRHVVQLGFQKRDSFRGENEWRAVVYQDPATGAHVEADVDLGTLIDSVCVSPKAQDHFFDAVSAAVETFCPGKRVWRSELISRLPRNPKASA
jgi:hypothetical protein